MNELDDALGFDGETVTSKVKGTAGSITATLSGSDGEKLTVSGTHTGASSTGDDNAVVAPVNGTDSTVSAATILAARKDNTLYLFGVYWWDYNTTEHWALRLFEPVIICYSSLSDTHQTNKN